MVLHFSRFISFQRVSLKVWSPETTSLYVFDAFFSISAIIRKIIYTKTIHQITIYSFIYEDSIFFLRIFQSSSSFIIFLIFICNCSFFLFRFTSSNIFFRFMFFMQLFFDFIPFFSTSMLEMVFQLYVSLF